MQRSKRQSMGRYVVIDTMSDMPPSRTRNIIFGAIWILASYAIALPTQNIYYTHTVDIFSPSNIAPLLTPFAALLCYPIGKAKETIDVYCFSRRHTELTRAVAYAVKQGSSQETLHYVARRAARILKLKNAELQVRVGENLVNTTATGRRCGRRHSIELNFQGESHGRFIAYVDETRPLDRIDQELLEEFAKELATGIHLLHLKDIRHKHHRIVSMVQNDVRHRVQRDLHDGVGPILAAVKMEVDAARALLRSDPVTVGALLEQAATDTEDAVASVRQLVSDLRVPAVHEMGLLAALAQQSMRFQRASAGRLRIDLDAPTRLPALSERVELAAFRIASEALTNTARHAHAHTCVIRVRVDGGLRLDIIDDGVGISGRSPAGIGLASMRERARELGGECTIVPRTTPGTHVTVRLPLT
jgi:signal transduction histidine kinase